MSWAALCSATSRRAGRLKIALIALGLLMWSVAIRDVSEVQFEQSWRVAALGLFTTAKALEPDMSQRGSGTIIVSGATAALRGNDWTTVFAPAKSAQRILANCLAPMSNWLPVRLLRRTS